MQPELLRSHIRVLERLLDGPITRRFYGWGVDHIALWSLIEHTDYAELYFEWGEGGTAGQTRARITPAGEERIVQEHARQIRVFANNAIAAPRPPPAKDA